MREWAVSAAVLAHLFAAGGAAAQPRELHWRAIDVSAQLGADGGLRVRERQAMVFTGDWNGGERVFELGRGESVQLHRLSRIAPDGPIALREGQPPRVDEYTWAGPTVLRWRSRAPSDPPFRAREIVYELEYTVSGVLRPQAGRYRLDYDFGLPKRSGPVERLSVDLRLGPGVRALGEMPARHTVGPLAPGTGHRVLLDVAVEGAAPLAAPPVAAPMPAPTPPPPGWAWAIFAAVGFVVAMRVWLFWRGERAAGRLEPLTPPERIDEAWLADNVLAIPAEVVGAVWDRSIGAAEVAATLARLEAEGKIETWPDQTDSSVRHLRLRVAPTALRGHERFLLDALLVDGGTETDTRAVRRHYASVGFDPTTVIQKPLEKEVRALLGHDRHPPAPLRWTTAVLVLAAVGAIASVLIVEGNPMPLFAGIALLPVYLVGVFLAFAWRTWVGSRGLAAAVLAPVALLAAGVVLAQAWGAGTDPLALGAVAVLAVAFANSVLNVARTRETAAAMRVRKRLTAAEGFLRRELRGGSAAVRPEWFPHLLALGLADDANRWSAARPTPDGVAVTSWRADGDGDRAAASSSRSEPFTAGGGRFGGAGASGSWGAAAHAFSASIAAPSSSSSDGSSSSSSGSSSSSSSGGGGGGGW